MNGRELPSGPVVYVRDDHLDVEWPDGKPHWFPITPELFQQMVDNENDRRALRRRRIVRWLHL